MAYRKARTGAVIVEEAFPTRRELKLQRLLELYAETNQSRRSVPDEEGTETRKNCRRPRYI